MRTELLMMIENLASGNKDKAIRYAELLIKNCEIEYRNNGDVLSKCDIGIAKNLLHILKGEPKEGDVAVLDSAKTVQEEKPSGLTNDELADRVENVLRGNFFITEAAKRLRGLPPLHFEIAFREDEKLIQRMQAEETELRDQVSNLSRKLKVANEEVDAKSKHIEGLKTDLQNKTKGCETRDLRIHGLEKTIKAATVSLKMLAESSSENPDWYRCYSRQTIKEIENGVK